MKKFLMGMVVVGTLCLTGCVSNNKSESTLEEKTMTCTRTTNQSGISMDLSYKVNYKGSTVTTVETIEKVTSDTESVLDTYKEQIEKIYAPYTSIEYYDNVVTIDGNTLTSKTNIDYSRIDTDKMIEIDSANGSIIKDGKVNIDTMKSLYESVGASCVK